MISIITPSFNQSDWLRLAIASVADQQGAIFEHIVQDCLSSDGTEGWLRNNLHVRAYFEKDIGMYDAINRGLHRARGAICAYLNCDEQYLPGTLARVVKFFELHPQTEVLFGDAILIDRSGTPLSYRRTILPDIQHIRASHLNTLSCATFFRRALLEQDFYFDEKWKSIADAIWVERLLKAKVSIATIREPLSIFTFTGTNLGAASLSEEEKVQMRNHGGDMHRSSRAQAILVHRIRKALAGAYRRRFVEFEIFTLDSPAKRQRRAGKVGFGWPQATSLRPV